MKATDVHIGPNGIRVWIQHEDDIQPFVGVSMGCFIFHMELESLDSLLKGLSKAWYEIHKDNHANCGCDRDSVKSSDNRFHRKGDGEP